MSFGIRDPDRLLVVIRFSLVRSFDFNGRYQEFSWIRINLSFSKLDMSRDCGSFYINIFILEKKKIFYPVTSNIGWKKTTISVILQIRFLSLIQTVKMLSKLKQVVASYQNIFTAMLIRKVKLMTN